MTTINSMPLDEVIKTRACVRNIRKNADLALEVRTDFKLAGS
jgi:hypothetical protein